MIDTSRRNFLTGAVAFVAAAPAIVRVGSLMRLPAKAACTCKLSIAPGAINAACDYCRRSIGIVARWRTIPIFLRDEFVPDEARIERAIRVGMPFGRHLTIPQMHHA